MPEVSPVLVTGAAGRVGAVGRTTVELLRNREVPVRAFVHREDERAEALRAAGAEVVVGDLTEAHDVIHAMTGCRRMYFGMSVSSRYLEATVTVAAAAREYGNLAALVNMSQMTVSQMTLTSVTESAQQRQHWLCEQVFEWSGLPGVNIRPTVFLENPIFMTIAASSIAWTDTIRLPFGSGRTSPIAARDVAEVIAAVLIDPTAHIGKTYELTGPRSQDMTAMASEYSAALGRPITYFDVPLQRWVDQELNVLGLPQYLREHLATMARLHRENRYDRLTHDVEAVIGRQPTSVRDFVADHAAFFAKPVVRRVS
jgi:NAD(P)H dehydrogenase (quinone)